MSRKLPRLRHSQNATASERVHHSNTSRCARARARPEPKPAHTGRQDKQQDGPTEDKRERGGCMLRGACRRGTHTFSRRLVKKTKENPPRTPTTTKNSTNTATQQQDKRKKKPRNATNKTDDDRRAAKATAEAGQTEEGDTKTEEDKTRR